MYTDGLQELFILINSADHYLYKFIAVAPLLVPIFHFPNVEMRYMMMLGVLEWPQKKKCLY